MTTELLLSGATFERAVPLVMKHEGGFVDHPADPGGATRYGISLRFLRNLGIDIDRDGDIDADDVRALTPELAMEIYRQRFWVPHHYSRFGTQEIATKVFDLAINTGPRQSHRFLQRASRSAGIYLVDDGLLGPNTWRAIEAHERQGSAGAVLAAIKSEAAGFYRLLVAKTPASEAFLDGWLRRAYH